MKIRKAEKREAGTGEITMEYAEQTFKELLAFQGYGFCLGYDVPVVEKIRGEIPIGKLNVGDSVLAPGDDGGERWERVENVIPQGRKEMFMISFSNGKTLNATLDHPILCSDGNLRSSCEIVGMYADGLQCEAMFRNLEQARITCVEYVGTLPVMDISISGRDHLFYANGCVVHNCKAHAVSYSVYSAVQMWLQEHYWLEYMCVLLTHIDRAKEKKGHLILNERVEYCIRHGTAVRYPDVNLSGSKWEIEAGALRAPIKNIKGFSDRDVELIESHRPYTSLKDFLDKTGMKYRKFESLLFAHAFDRWGTVDELYNWYYNHYFDDGRRKSAPAASDDLFDLDGGDECSSASDEVIREFSKPELEDLCLDMNGFVIHDNIRIRYSGYYGRQMADIEEGYPKAVVRPISEIKGMDKSEFADIARGGKEMWTLAEVKGTSGKIRTRNGYDMYKVSLSDGDGSLELAFFNNPPPSCMRRGNVLVFPLWVTYNEDREEVKASYSSFTANKHEPVVLHKEE